VLQGKEHAVSHGEHHVLDSRIAVDGLVELDERARLESIS
jgi:hypothetical protein